MTAPDRFRVIQRILLPGLLAALATGVLARGGRLETPYSRPDELGRLVSDSESIFLGRCVSSVAQTLPGASAALVTVVFEVERQILGPRQGQVTLRFYRPLPMRAGRLPPVPSPAEAAEPGYVAGSESARDRISRLQSPSSRVPGVGGPWIAPVRFHEGEEVVLFLPEPSASGITKTRGAGFAKFSVFRRADGVRAAIASAGPAGVTARPFAPQGAEGTLEKFLQQIESRVELRSPPAPARDLE